MIDLSKRQRAWLVFPNPLDHPERMHVELAPEDEAEYEEACNHLACTELFYYLVDAPTAAAALAQARELARAGRDEWGW